MSLNKKRNVEDILVNDEDPFGPMDQGGLPPDSTLLGEVAMLKNELRQKDEEIQQLKAKIAAYEEEEESSDEEDEEESVCDGTPWSKKYHLLKAYKLQNGHCNVPRNDKLLGIWVKDQKANYNQKKKNMTKDRINKLEKLGFQWSKDHPVPKTWDDMFQDLVNFKSTFGHCNIPINEDPALRTPLAKWVVDQRKYGKHLRKQMPTEMTLDHYKRLSEMDFIWKPRKK